MAVQSASMCSGTGSYPLNALLGVVDSAIGTTVKWSLGTASVHGSVACAYVSAASGGLLMPTGLSYAPAGGYRGTDTFSVLVSDCGNPADTATIVMSIDSLPTIGVLTGADTVCIGHTVVLSDTTAGGAWGAKNTKRQ